MMTMIEKMKSQKILNNLKSNFSICSNDTISSLFTFNTITAGEDLEDIKTYINTNASELSAEMLTKCSEKNVLLSTLKPRINYDNIDIYFTNSKYEIYMPLSDIINNEVKLYKNEEKIYIQQNNDIWFYECFVVNDFTNFFTKDELYRLQRMLLALTAEYNPIENTDVNETYSESMSQSGSELFSQSDSHTTSNTANSNATNGRTHNIANSASDTNQVVAFNANTLTDAGKDINSLSTSESESTTASEHSSFSETANGGLNNNRSTQGYQTIGHTLRRHGNIGVTTNQQMIASELELRGSSFYDIIINVIGNKIFTKIY